jgi:Domain of unknown function (DUF1876)/Domain of unknown function (DUF1918)
MQAAVGDRIVVAGGRVDAPVRDGRVVEVRHADGTPPYVVEWGDTGTRALFFPGPDARVEPAGEQREKGPEPHTKIWRVDVHIYEQDADTDARAVLVAESPRVLEGRGHAHRRPGDADVPEVGDEVAVARALRRLADHLLGVAADDIAGIEGRPVILSQ